MPKKDIDILNWQHQYPRGPRLEKDLWQELKDGYSSSQKTTAKKPGSSKKTATKQVPAKSA